MRFGRIRLELRRAAQGRLSRGATFRSMIESARIQIIIAEDELAKCSVERWVPGDGALKKLDSFAQFYLDACAGARNQEQGLAPAVEVKGGNVRGRTFFE